MAQVQAVVDPPKPAVERRDPEAVRRVFEDRDSLAGEDLMLRSVVHKAIQARDSWEKVQERFVQDLRSDPANALGWSNKVFTAAAQYTVAQEVIYYFEGGRSREEITSILTDRVLREARSPSRSTSPTSNLVEQDLLAARADFLGSLTGKNI